MRKVEELALKMQKETKDILDDSIKLYGGADMLLGMDTESVNLMHKSMILMATYMDLGVEEAKELSLLNEKLDIIIGKLNKLEK